MKQKLITFHFKSGNSCDVLVDMERFKVGNVNSIFIEWDRFPPSRQDQAEWKKVGASELGKKVVQMGLMEGRLIDYRFPSLEAFCTSGDSPGEEDHDR